MIYNTDAKQNEYFYSMLTEEERELLKYMPTVNGLLAFASSQFADRPAISDGNVTYTYKQLNERVAVRRGYLKKLKLNKGDRVAVFSPNTLEAMELYLAIVTSGCISVMLPAQLDSVTLAGLCKKFGVSAVFYDKSLEEKAVASGITAYKSDFVDCEPAPAATVFKDTI